MPAADALGAVLAHSVPAARLRKGRVIGAADLDHLAAAGVTRVTVARLDPGDVAEDDAAQRLAGALAPDPAALGLVAQAPFTGRANLYAAGPGVLRVDAARLGALNALDESITLATLPDYARVAARQMVATVKIIPYAAPGAALAQAESLLAAGPALRLHGLQGGTASLIVTRLAGQGDRLVLKGVEAVRRRLQALDLALTNCDVVAHEIAPLAAALAAAPGGLVLILTGSATSDRGDIGPAALIAAGGSLTRFGMPVDPGNLLFLGRLGARPVIGLPGCARSPKLNGADWVLERLACGIDVGARQIAAMGVGGLLTEIPARPMPRGIGPAPGRRPVVAAVLLAAGASRRMGGADKLLEPIDGEPLIARVAARLAAAGIDDLVVVLPPGDTARSAALAALPTARRIENPRAAEGMGTSLALGVAAVRPDADGVLLALADMPDLETAHYDRLIAAFDPGEGRAIIRATGPGGVPGQPVLFGARFFEALRALGGDTGARGVIDDHPEFVVEVPLGAAAQTDLDTPAAWNAWRAAAQALTPVAPTQTPPRDT